MIGYHYSGFCEELFAQMAWVKDNFRPEVEVVVAAPSTALPPNVVSRSLVDGLVWANPVTDGMTLGSDLFKVTTDESMIRTLAKEVNMTPVLEHYSRGQQFDRHAQRLKMGLNIRPLQVGMSERRSFETE